MDQINCPVCKSQKASLFENFGVYNLYRCSHCDLVYSSPMKGMSRDEYASEYGSLGLHEAFASALSTGQKLFLKRQAGKIDGLKTLLDIGTSTGLFVSACAKKGFRAFGLESDRAAVSVGKNLFPETKIYQQNLVDLLKRREKFDYVTAFEVLEHVESPFLFLTQCFELLKPGGILAIFVPNRNRPPALYQEMVDRKTDVPPHHLTKWSKKSLVYVFQAVGLKRIFVRDIGKYRFPSLPAFGLAARVRSKIINKKDLPSVENGPNGSNNVYHHGYRHLFSFLSDLKILLDKIIFWWKDVAWRTKGYERDGLYIEGRFI